MFVPIGAQHLKTPYLRCAANVFADAWTDVEVADAHQTDFLADVFRQTVAVTLLGQVGQRDIFESNGQVVVNELLHLALNLLLFLA